MLPKWVKPYNIVELCAELCFTLPLSLSQKHTSPFYAAIAQYYYRCHTPVLSSFFIQTLIRLCYHLRCQLRGLTTMTLNFGVFLPCIQNSKAK